MGRNRYVDLLRVLAIGGVVYGHWLLVPITYTRGQLSGDDASSYISGQDDTPRDREETAR
jgi:hypothetical protein